jgi:Uma2 family endonuclease
MEHMATKALMSAVEFAEMDTDETERYELVEGELVLLSSGNPLHAEIRGLVELLLRLYFRANTIGRVLSEMDCRLSDDTVRCPDVSVLLGAKSKGFDWKKAPLPFAPDIAVEVLSPSERVADVHRKALQYLAAGAQEVWQFDFENGEIFIQTNTGIRLLRGEDPLETPLLPGFSVTVNTLLATPTA